MDKMTPGQFCFWLQGLVETLEADNVSEQQWGIIKDHLRLVFRKETPYYNRQPDTFTKTTLTC